ncbi:hypothetical protein [Stratiformator vulcanicus]|nr:hypothetical protein [Stratiformator vulcanicus]
MRRLPRKPLVDAVSRVLVRQGMFAADAGVSAERLFDLLAVGVDGIEWFGGLIKKIELGEIDPRGQLVQEEKTGDSGVVFDAGPLFPPAALTKVCKAIERSAATTGSAAAIVSMRNRFGPASPFDLLPYCSLITDSRFIGWASSLAGEVDDPPTLFTLRRTDDELVAVDLQRFDIDTSNLPHLAIESLVRMLDDIGLEDVYAARQEDDSAPSVLLAALPKSEFSALAEALEDCESKVIPAEDDPIPMNDFRRTSLRSMLSSHGVQLDEFFDG